MSKSLVFFMAFLAIVLIGVSQSMYIVDQREQAIVLQLGQPVGNPEDPASFVQGPGLHFKIPLVQDVVYFDRRILSVDPPPEQVVISSASVVKRGAADPANSEAEGEQNNTSSDYSMDNLNVTGEPIILDTFARYRIIDPLQFLKTLGSIREANSKLENILIANTRTVLGKTALHDLLSPARAEVMVSIQTRVNNEVNNSRMGLEIVDVRIVRADLTPALRTSTVQRMISELKKRATETRAKGEERALEIRSTAEKERTVLLAEAQRDSEIMRGEGDKEAIKIYADAFNKDKEFYDFLRSMEAYRSTLADPDTQMILSPNSDFLKYLGNAGAKN